MKRVLRSAFLALLVAPLWSASAVVAQDGAAGPGLVAVLDVYRVFNENAEHAQQMDQIKQAADSVKAEVEGQLQQIAAEAQGLARLNLGSEERNAREASLEQRHTALKTKARQQELELLNREARVYYQTWNRMQEVLTRIAQHNNISLVIRFDSAEIDPEDRNGVIKGVNRAVIYHDRLDLTDLVIQQMGPTVARNGAAQPAR